MSEVKKKQSIGNLYQKYGIFVIMIGVFLIASLSSKNFLKPTNLTNILKQITPVAIFAAGETMMLVSGNIDLSVSAVAGIASCLAALTLIATGNLLLCVLVAIGTSVIANSLSGIMITKLKLPSFIATLATMNICKGLAYVLAKGAISGVDELQWLSSGYLFGFLPSVVIVMAIVLLIIQFIMKRTRLGLYMYAVGGNRKASIASGINANRIVRITYAINGILVGIGAIVLTARMMSATPNLSNGSYEFDAITATVVGGTSFIGGFGSMFNVIIGVIIIGIINNGMVLMGIDSNWQIVVKGLLIAAAVAIDINTKKQIGN